MVKSRTMMVMITVITSAMFIIIAIFHIVHYVGVGRFVEGGRYTAPPTI